MVVKKNATILRNLISWLRLQNATGGTQAGSLSIPSPVLVIDDEADHASMNTARDPEADPTRINQLIRELLLSFNRVGFVGYTATPFANIFAFHEECSSPFGPDLFPRSFIMNLKAPSDYVGPGLVFGHPGDESAGIPEQPPLPMYVPVLDSAPWIPDRHRRDCIPGTVPESLRDAIRLFVLVCAARATRGQADVHNSMLVHATRFIDVQEKVEREVADEVDGLRNLIGLGSASDVSRTEQELRAVWEQRIVRDHASFRHRLAERCPPLPDWRSLWGHVGAALKRIQPMRINGKSTDALAYSRKPEGLYVIAVGGDKLSRGLTLEGLSVSYFLRASSMFDTLMQMGRWFGYRAGYVDLCRVYTTPALHSAFREISLAMDDLRADLDYMAAVGKTPKDFGLRVRAPSDGLLITAANKIRCGEDVQVRFANTIVQALEIPSTGAQANQNRAALLRLLERLGEPDHRVRGDETPHSLWRDVSAALVLDFLGEYEAFATPSFFNHCEALRRYVHEQVSHDELTNWAIVVVGKKSPRFALPVGQRAFPLVFRTRKPGTPVDRFETQGVVGSADEALDLDEAEFAKAIELSPVPAEPGKATRGQPARDAVRQARPDERGLLLLYLLEPPAPGTAEDFVPSVAISFPESERASPLTYKVNKVWLEQRGLVAEWDDDASLP